MGKSFLLEISLSSILLLAGQAQASSLWTSDSWNGPVLYELDASTGAVLNSMDGPGSYADAISLANDGQSLFVLDSSTNSDVYQIGLAGNVLNSYHVGTDAEGLTILDDGTLVVGGGSSHTVAFVNPANGAILSQFTPVSDLYGMSSNGVDRLYGLNGFGVIETYDLSGDLLSTLDTDVPGMTLGLANSDNGFFISSVGSMFLGAGPGSMIFQVDSLGNTVNSFAGQDGFTEGLDYLQTCPTVPAPAAILLGGLGAGIVGWLRRRRTF